MPAVSPIVPTAAEVEMVAVPVAAATAPPPMTPVAMPVAVLISSSCTVEKKRAWNNTTYNTTQNGDVTASLEITSVPVFTYHPPALLHFSYLPQFTPYYKLIKIYCMLGKLITGFIRKGLLVILGCRMQCRRKGDGHRQGEWGEPKHAI